MTNSSRMKGVHLSRGACINAVRFRMGHQQVVKPALTAGRLLVCRVHVCMLPVSDGITLAIKK